MEDSCPATPLHVFTGRDSKSPLHVAISSPESDVMKSPSDRLSPDSRCVICLGRLQNKSFTDSCLHQFCFQCLLQWSKVKPECPLCKQPFKSIIHNVRSNSDYDQYHVERQETAGGYSLTGLLHSNYLGSIGMIRVHPRHRYRTTVTPEYFRELAESFRETRRWLDNNSFEIPPLVPVDSTPPPLRRRGNRHSGTTHRPLRHRSTSEFRRSVYAQDLWVQDLADVSGRYRECTPQFYRDNPGMIHRVIPWLNREVNVLLDHCQSHAMYVIDQIVNMLPTHSIKSREFKAAVQPYFGAQTDHFIHEFYTFARSVYDMSGFDENAVYVYANNPNFATEVQEISSSDTDSDIEVIQTVKPNERRDSNKRKTTTTTTTATTSATPSASSSGNGQGFKKILLKRAEGGGSNYVVSTSSSVAIEPVAGPSGLSTKLVQETIEVCESDPDEVEVLDYVKPEPELVTLSSGEEEEVGQREDSRQRKPSNDITNFLNIFADGQSPILSLSSTDLNFSTSVDANSSGESYHPTNEKRKSTCKSPKGKCKSDGSGLKGKQKRKYVRKTKKDKRSSSSESEKESRRCRRRRRSSSSVSSSSSSSSSSSDTSPSDYEPIAKYLTKKKDVRTSKKSKKLKKSRKKSKKESKRKVKSCVVVPRKNKVRYESEEDEDSSRPLESYWSQVKTSGKLTKVRLKRKRSNSSSSENSLRRVKYTSRIVYDTSDTSNGLSSNNSTNNVENSRTDNSGSDNQFDGNSTGTNQVASSSSEINIRINLNSDSSD